jgi:hypothetical protein
LIRNVEKMWATWKVDEEEREHGKLEGIPTAMEEL